ncbi:O-methyltransferase [Klebsiella michiganensis]|uniref:O-methyltransferase n=1 Tax=Klebsiella michiganensis TaxID=1134687 RepID=A0A7H4LTL4_9ENTR|nr:O-methyltransferase [Klebsiella michiganensis]
MTGARRILEIGTLGGYSTIWMARELPADGELLTLEADAHHAAVARENLRLAGVDDRVAVLEGPALTSLETLGERLPFDLIFIDADKPNNPHYLRWALRYSRPGTVIVGDNVVRDGEVTNPESADERVQGVRAFIDMIGQRPATDGHGPANRGQQRLGWVHPRVGERLTLSALPGSLRHRGKRRPRP